MTARLNIRPLLKRTIQITERLAWVLAIALSVPSARAAPTVTGLDARIMHAQRFVSVDLMSKVLNSGATFQWIGQSDRLWFRGSTSPLTSDYIVVDAKTGRRAALFDRAAMAEALSAASVKPIGPRAMTVTSVFPDGRGVVVSLSNSIGSCDASPATAQCATATARFRCDLPVTACARIAEPLQADEIASPDGMHVAFVRDHNLWMRDSTDGGERQLTRDGVENFAYGKILLQADDQHIARRRAGQPEPLNGIVWSPDGRYILALRHDLRNVPLRLTVTEYLPPEGGSPIIHTDRVAVAGDLTYPDAVLNIVDIADRTVRRTDVDPRAFADLAVIYFNDGWIWWSKDDQLLVIDTYLRVLQAWRSEVDERPVLRTD